MKTSMIATVRAALGDRVTVSDVRAQFPSAVGEIMRKGVRLQRGVYSIAEDRFQATFATPTTETKEIASMKSENPVHSSIQKIGVGAEVSFVPETNKEYIPHGCYEVVKRVVSKNRFCPIYIVGESGNGKTFGVEQACASAKRELVLVNITNETAEEDLIGSYVLQDGNMVWKDGPVIVAMRRGAVLCLDELDQTTPRIMCLNTIAQGKPYYIKKTNEVVTPAPGFTLIGTANTKGTGDGIDTFAGAQILNEAFLERFNITVEQSYPSEATERKILECHTADSALIDRLVKFAKVTRKAYQDGAMNHCITTRRLVQICQNIEIFGGVETKNAERNGIKYAIARFDEETRDSFAELYDKLLKGADVEDTVPPQVETW